MKKILLLLASAFISHAALADQNLAQSKNCFTCHSVDHKVLGPAFKDVAKKYTGNKTAVAQLTQKVMKGGTGTWGSVAMPPNPQVNADEAKKLVTWILGLK